MTNIRKLSPTGKASRPWFCLAAAFGGRRPAVIFSRFFRCSFRTFLKVFPNLRPRARAVIPDVEIVPKSILLWRSLTQWLGGLGVIMIFIVLLPQLSGSAVQLFNSEFGGFSFNKMLPRMKNTAWVIFGVYLIIQAFAETLLLMCACHLNFFDAFQSFSLTTVATEAFLPITTAWPIFTARWWRFTLRSTPRFWAIGRSKSRAAFAISWLWRAR